MLPIYAHGADLLRLFKDAYRYHTEKRTDHMPTQTIRELIHTILADLLQDSLFTIPGLARELHVTEESIENLYTQEHHEPSCSLAFGLLYLHCEHFPAVYSHENQLASAAS